MIFTVDGLIESHKMFNSYWTWHHKTLLSQHNWISDFVTFSVKISLKILIILTFETNWARQLAPILIPNVFYCLLAMAICILYFILYTIKPPSFVEIVEFFFVDSIFILLGSSIDGLSTVKTWTDFLIFFFLFLFLFSISFYLLNDLIQHAERRQSNLYLFFMLMLIMMKINNHHWHYHHHQYWHYCDFAW